MDVASLDRRDMGRAASPRVLVLKIACVSVCSRGQLAGAVSGVVRERGPSSDCPCEVDHARDFSP